MLSAHECGHRDARPLKKRRRSGLGNRLNISKCALTMSKNTPPKHEKRPGTNPFSSCGRQFPQPEEINLRKEVEAICRSASEGVTKVAGLCKLVFFSTATGDGWMLDWEDQPANCLMKNGSRQLCEFGETDKSFGIKWQGRYQIAGDSFFYTNSATPGRVTAASGHPTQAILSTIAQSHAAS